MALKKQPHLLIAGGGTGGHYFCGLAVAEIFLTEFPEGFVDLVGTRYGIEARTPLSDSRMKLHFIRSKGVKGRGLFAKFLALAWFVVGVLQSLAFILRTKPSMVLGVGGYASGAPVLAALLLKPFQTRRIFVLEQNSHMGLANRFLVKMGAKALSTFPFPQSELVPMPLRSNFRSAPPLKFEWPPKKVLIMGGSQGARGLNRAWCDLLPLVRQKYPELKFIHQTGREDFDRVKEAYRKLGFEADVFAFHDPMIEKYREADFVVCRAGALTAFELAQLRLPALFIPFPSATDNHQEKNALFMQDEAWVIRERELTAEAVLKLWDLPTPSIPTPRRATSWTWSQILRESFHSES